MDIGLTLHVGMESRRTSALQDIHVAVGSYIAVMLLEFKNHSPTMYNFGPVKMEWTITSVLLLPEGLRKAKK